MDPLHRDLPLRHTYRASVIGKPVRYESNSEEILQLVRDVFPVPAGKQRECDPECLVRISVCKGQTQREATAGVAVTYWSPEPNRLLVFAGSNVGVAEIDRQLAYAYLGETFVEFQSIVTQYAFLQTLTLVMAASVDRAPIHAATLSRGARGLLLAGGSGCGKSTLAYAAHRAGWSLWGEDVAYIRSEPSMIFAVPGRVHLTLKAARIFPELAHERSVTLPSGKQKAIVRVPQKVPAAGLLPGNCGICLLSRARGNLRVEPATRQEVAETLCNENETGFDFFAGATRQAAHRLAREVQDCWKLTLTSDPTAAVPVLYDLLQRLDLQPSAAGR